MAKSKKRTYGKGIERATRRIAAPRLPYEPQDPKRFRPAIGLIGCGGVTDMHLRAYKKAGYNVVALCNPHLEKAEARRREFFPKATVYSDYRELLKRDDIEVVDIATHPEIRSNQIEESLKAGKHVLSQKPFVTDLNRGERLADLADEKGLRLAVNQNGRWAPHFSYIRHAVARGLVGDVQGVHFAVQ
ncbi:MAG TPA: Gfo/Idh/MocA family oxidoreductase, partial [Tepidisphaeraceae bacterium]|nr:Gfo/Idh/MocA family oxidoreductase [Tepidisphaeraceae bacterium]